MSIAQERETGVWTAADRVLTGGQVVPGFRLELKDLFARPRKAGRRRRRAE